MSIKDLGGRAGYMHTGLSTPGAVGGGGGRTDSGFEVLKFATLRFHIVSDNFVNCC